MFMFGDFNFSEVLEVIDTLVGEKKRGSYEEFMNMTIRDVMNIINVIINKEREQELKAHAGDLKAAKEHGQISGDASYDKVSRLAARDNGLPFDI